MTPCRKTPRPSWFAPLLAEGILGRQDIPVFLWRFDHRSKKPSPEELQVHDFMLESVHIKITLRVKTGCLLSSLGNPAAKKRHVYASIVAFYKPRISDP